jgi:hypothetical protein
MAEMERTDATRPFRELHGDYVENAGQQINLREYLDYFEPLGSALARLPDGTGGPFVHHFTDSGGRTISSLGWVVSAKSKRFGGWKLWGTWSSQPMPAVALPLFWPALSDASRVSDWIGRANGDADRLLDASRSEEVLGSVKSTRLREKPFREYLKAELSRAYAVPLPHRHPIEIELAPGMLDLLPWLYLLGPVDPAVAQVKPNRFDMPGYQYILTENLPAGADIEIPSPIERMVDEAAKSAAAGWRMANELRARRNRPPRREAPQSRERNDMRTGGPSTHTSSRKTPEPPLGRAVWNEGLSLANAIWKPLYQIAVLALLAWIAWNVNVIRKATVPTHPEPAAAVESTTTQPETHTDVAPVYEPDLSRTRIRRLATVLTDRPPQGIRFNATVRDEIARGGTDATGKLARVAIEVFLRHNGCFARTEVVDGKLSAAELRAIRNCAVLQDERLMKDATDPDVARAIDWLERTVA